MPEQSNKPKLCNEGTISPLLRSPKEEMPEVPRQLSVIK